VSYEESVTLIREQLAAVLEAEEDWAKAASILSGIDLDSGTAITRFPSWNPHIFYLSGNKHFLLSHLLML
jgi:hypothetical protein